MECNEEKSDNETRLNAKISELENSMLEQEHRLIPILLNVFSIKTKFGNDPQKKNAVLRSLFFKLFSAGTVTTVGVGLFGLLGLIIAMRANSLLEIQNHKMDVQSHLAEAQRRASVMFELTSIMEQIQHEVDAIPSDQRGEGQLIKLSRLTAGRVLGLSRVLKPYRYLDVENKSTIASTQNTSIFNQFWVNQDTNEPILIDRELSPERGQLLVTLINAHVDIEHIGDGTPDFSYALLDGVDFSNTNFKGAKLNYASFMYTTLKGAEFKGAYLLGADFTECFCQGANFDNVRGFYGARLGAPENFEYASFKHAFLLGAVVDRIDWLTVAEENGIEGIDEKDWYVESSPNGQYVIRKHIYKAE